MKDHSILILFAFASFFLLPESLAVDKIHANQPIKDGNTIVSDGEMFQLGFLAPETQRIGTWEYGTRRFQQVPLYG